MIQLLVVEGLTNSGKTTVCRALNEALARAGVRSVLAASIYDADNVHLALAQITHPSTYADHLDRRTESLLYLAHLMRKVECIRSAAAGSQMVIVDRLEPSAIAQAYDMAEPFRSLLHSMIRAAVGEFESKFGVLLDVTKNVSVERSHLSPFSRKDARLMTAWENHREALHCSFKQEYPTGLLVDAALSTDRIVELIIEQVERA